MNTKRMSASIVEIILGFALWICGAIGMIDSYWGGMGGGLMGVGYEKALLMQTDGNLAVSELISTYVYKRGLTGVPDQAYATAIGLFTGVVGLVLVSASNWFSKKFTGDGIY